MDRAEAVLRELNIYPLWKRRVRATEQTEAVDVAAVAEAPVVALASVLEVAQVVTLAPEVAPAAAALTHRNLVEPPRVLNDIVWPALKQLVSNCTACKLRAGCSQTVFGVGDEQADWLFVGEAPGADEDVQGIPFVGKVGKLLDNMLAAIKLKRGQNVYISNAVKCRPPGNLAPDAQEIATCLPYLQRQIDLLQPKLIVALGKTAATALLGRDATLSSLRGKPHDYHGIPLVITYHPAYLLRSPSEKAKVWQDLLLAVQLMQERG